MLTERQDEVLNELHNDLDNIRSRLVQVYRELYETDRENADELKCAINSITSAMDSLEIV
jgi:hypothetical protein